jgi:DMSO/TMAO reductase YedYZ molybdopterin-dependent catalytic subunit
MDDHRRLAEEHLELTRRYFLGLGAAGIAALTTPLGSSVASAEPGDSAALAEAVAKLGYLTPLDQFALFGRGTPPPHELSPEKRREVGLDKETWRLEVVPDSKSDCQVENPLSKERGTALDWPALMKLAEKHAVRYLKVMTCTNMADPCGMGLWEGVPLREVVWLARPKANFRRVFYCGYNNDDIKQRFQGSLSADRVLEDPPGELPVILCYKLNGQWLTPKAGAPVRLVVPEAYGNRSVKWLQRIVLTNNPQANDTYAEWNNDVESTLKTYARFLQVPTKIKSGQPAAVTGVAQVGMSGLGKVQYGLHPQSAKLPEDDPHFAKADWRDAAVLPPPAHWGGGLPDGKLPPLPAQIDAQSGKPRQWPLRNTIVHWAFLLENVPPGEYHLRCRTIDAAGSAQPMPRPFPKSGNNAIHQVTLTVEA